MLQWRRAEGEGFLVRFVMESSKETLLTCGRFLMEGTVGFQGSLEPWKPRCKLSSFRSFIGYVDDLAEG
jgi:hypothetical protein